MTLMGRLLSTRLSLMALMVVLMAWSAVATAAVSNGTLSLSKSTFDVNESITIDYLDGSGSNEDWVGIYEAGTLPGSCQSADAYLDWSYTNGSSGSVTLGGLSEGDYVVQLFEDNGWCHIGGSIAFTVTDGNTGGGGSGTVLELSKTEFDAGESITVDYLDGSGSNEDWVGIYAAGTLPASCQSADQYIEWSYTNGSSGSVTLDGVQEGDYVVQLFEDNGWCHIGDSVPFTVTGGGSGGGSDDVTLQLSKSEFDVGESVTVDYQGGSGSSEDWVGIYAAGTLPDSCQSADAYLEWSYTNGSGGSVTLDGVQEGDYIVQLFEDNGWCHLGEPVSFTVTASDGGGGGGSDATLQLSKTEFSVGESITVDYQGGSGSDQDWVGIYRAGSLGASCSSDSDYIEWSYTNGSGGSVTLNGVSEGDYIVQLFEDNGWCHIGDPVSFSVESSGGGGGTGGGGTGEGTKVAFIGDTGYWGNFQDVLNLIRSEGAELTIVAGDTSYDSSNDDTWHDMVRDTLRSGDPALVVAGNHDYGDSDIHDVISYGVDRLNNAPDVNCSGDYAEQMTCQYKNVYFVLSAIGSGGSYSDHENYISRQLSNAPADAWRVCAWHKNQRDMQVGGKGNEVGWTAYETCRREGAIISTGHEHSYSRTHLLSDMSEQSVASTSSTFTVTEGETFAFVSGLGGVGIRDQERGGSHWASIYTSTQGARYGALFGTFYEDRADFYFKNVRGEIIDSFTVIKGY